MDVLIYSALALGASVLLALIPFSVLEAVTSPFSLGKTGIRVIRRRRDSSDTIANVALGISLLYALIYWLIPVHTIVYAVLLILSYLCVMGQTTRVLKKSSFMQRFSVITGINLMFFFGLFAELGCFNGFGLLSRISMFGSDVIGGEAWDLFYFLQDPTFMMVLMQAILYLIPMYCMWAQFKYMRLEDTFKSRYAALFLIKTVFIAVVIVVFAYQGLEVLNWAYHLTDTEV